MSVVTHWIHGEDDCPENFDTFPILNPLDDSRIGKAVRGTAGDVERAVAVADSVFATYCQTLPREREGWLLRAAELLNERAELFVDLLIEEIGSPILKAKREIATATGVLRAAAGAARRMSGQTLPTNVAGRLSFSMREPLGVVAGVTPFNVPLIKNVKHSAMALATGNTVVLLPSEECPAVAIELAKLYAEAGLPAGAFNVVVGRGAEIGDALTSHPLVRFVGFTGSTKTGRHVATQCARFGKRSTLEMGGKNPLIVCEDADLVAAIQGSVVGAFLYGGQICLASSRIYVQGAMFDQFLAKFAGAASQLGMGDLRDEKTMIAPLINERQRGRVRTHLEDAISKGARVVTGGEWVGNRLQPTVLVNVPEGAILFREETFGPIAAVYAVETVEEAIEQANATDYGLVAAVYTASMRTALRCVREIRAGMVHVNGTTIQEEAHVPFGGIGDSGHGREGSEVGIDELTEWKWVTVDGG